MSSPQRVSPFLNEDITLYIPSEELPLSLRQYMFIYINPVVDKFFQGGRVTQLLLEYLENHPYIGNDLIRMGTFNINDVTVEDREQVYIQLEQDWLGETRESLGFSLTPWGLEKSKAEDERLSELFGQKEFREELPIVVVSENQQYRHNMSEPLAVGILSALSNQNQIQLYLADVIDAGVQNPAPLRLEDVQRDYIFQEENQFNMGNIAGAFFVKLYEQYYNVVEEEIEQFLRGVITGARWTGQDPHQVVTEIKQRNRFYTF